MFQYINIGKKIAHLFMVFLNDSNLNIHIINNTLMCILIA